MRESRKKKIPGPHDGAHLPWKPSTMRDQVNSALYPTFPQWNPESLIFPEALSPHASCSFCLPMTTTSTSLPDLSAPPRRETRCMHNFYSSIINKQHRKLYLQEHHQEDVNKYHLCFRNSHINTIIFSIKNSTSHVKILNLWECSLKDCTHHHHS